MNRQAALVLSTLLGITTACATMPLPSDRPPDWLAAIIDGFEHPPVPNPPSYVARYGYRGQTVYYVGPRCCDIRSVVYDAKGTVLCEADGGIDGKGDGRCPDFISARQQETILWRPPTS